MAAEQFIADICGHHHIEHGPGLIRVPDRPLLASVPWQHHIEPLDMKRLSIWTVSLAEAFFQRAAASISPSRN